MRQYRLLDAFCGAGGSARGFQQAGFYVVGVDNKKQKRYVGDEFYQDDALAFIEKHGHEFDVIAASPPCQRFSRITPEEVRESHPDLIAPTRKAILRTHRPYVIENVPGARKHLIDPVMLCGTYFDLKVYRHRYFESNMPLVVPTHKPHHDRTPSSGRGVSPKGFVSVSGSGGRFSRPLGGGTYSMSEDGFVSVTGHFSGLEYCRMAMGIDWMSVRELSQSIPPAYTEYLGKQIIEWMQNDGTR